LFTLKTNYTDIFYRWFQGFDWEGLVNRSMVPPIVPKVILYYIWKKKGLTIPMISKDTKLAKKR